MTTTPVNTRIPTASTIGPNVVIPTGATVSSGFEEYGDDYRALAGATRPVAGSTMTVWAAAEQHRDGTVGRGRVGIDDGQTQLLTLTADAARALAAALVEAADELDRLATSNP